MNCSKNPPDDRLPLNSSFRDACRGRILFASFSGGADSTALVLALAKEKLPFTAVHFTHGIRDASCGEKDYAFCADFCRGLGVPLLHDDLEVPVNRRPGEGDEEAARRLRLEAWKKLLPPSGAVVTGHHADDAAETLLMRLLRGGNVSALAGLREESEVGGIVFLRPFLAFPRERLRAFLRANGISCWREDETNREDVYLRNFIRNRLLPEISEKMPGAGPALRASAENLRIDAEYIEKTASELYEKGDPADPAFWRGLHPAAAIRLLRRFLSERTGCDIIPDRHLLARFEDLLQKGRNGVLLELPDTGRALTLSQGKLCIPDRPPDVKSVMWDYRKTPEIRFGDFLFTARFAGYPPETDKTDPTLAYFDVLHLPEILQITVRHEGDRMIPFGAHSPRKLKKILTDARFAAGEKDGLPVLRAGDDILWIPGVKRSALALCGEKTKEVVIIGTRKTVPDHGQKQK